MQQRNKQYDILSFLFLAIMLGSHYRFLSIASKSHRQKGRSQIDTCVQKQLLENYLRAVPDELNMEKRYLKHLSVLTY